MTQAAPDWTYVNNLLLETKRELEGFHKRVNEVENIRYLEEKALVGDQEKRAGFEVRIGSTAELIENVKSALTTNLPHVTVRPFRKGPEAQSNSSKRELFWNAFFEWATAPTPVWNELADAQAGLGLGILKGSYYPWPKNERRRLPKESDDDYLRRQEALKKLWGPPLRVLTVHPLAFYFRLGAGNTPAEIVEHSWKPRRQVYKDNKMTQDPQGILLEELSASMGQPIEDIRPLPYGTSTETLALVSEYWSPDWYQVYVDGHKVHQESPPSVRYFLAVGRTTSSKDPDKYGLSVAEILRHNEPIINRTLTKMYEASDLLVNKRLTIEVPEGYTEEVVLDEGNNPVTKSYTFTEEKATVLPAQAKVVDPFSGVEAVYGALPMINLLLQLNSQHGVSPLFKGVPPGAAGSGYRDNSLYLMARSQFQYLLDAYQTCIQQFVVWGEQLLQTHIKQEMWVEDSSLEPSDTKDWPAKVMVTVAPYLPQNIIAEGQFYDRMHSQGHIPRRLVLEKGMHEEQPEALSAERMEEDLQEMLKPILYKDVLETVLPKPKPQLVGPNGEPISSNGNNPMNPQEGGGPGGAQMMMSMMKEGQGEAGQAMGGYSRAGQSRQPPEEAGAFPPGMTEGT